MKNPKLKKYAGLLLAAVALIGCIVVWWGYAQLTALVQARLKVLVSPDVSVAKVTARWNRIELDQVRIARRGNGTFAQRFSCDRIVITPSLMSLFSGRLDITEISLENPYLLLEINPDGSFVKILTTGPASTATSSSGALPVHIADMRISKGVIELLDWQVARKNVIGGDQGDQYPDGALTIPITEQSMAVRLELDSQAGGHLLVTGDIAPSGLDTHLKLDLNTLNIMPFRPYFQKQGDLEISAGTLSASSTLTINKRILNAPGTLHLKGLDFDHNSTKGALLGVPSWALVSFLSDHNDELSVQFKISGNLDNPRFSIHQSLVDQVATALSSKIGVPTVSDVGKGIMGIGEKGIKGLFGITGSKK